MTTEEKTKVQVRERHFQEPKENVFVYAAEFLLGDQEHFIQARVDKIECPIEKFRLLDWSYSGEGWGPSRSGEIEEFVLKQVQALSSKQRTMAKYFYYV